MIISILKDKVNMQLSLHAVEIIQDDTENWYQIFTYSWCWPQKRSNWQMGQCLRETLSNTLYSLSLFQASALTRLPRIRLTITCPWVCLRSWLVWWDIVSSILENSCQPVIRISRLSLTLVMFDYFQLPWSLWSL